MGLTRLEGGYKDLADVHSISVKPYALMLGEMRCTWREGVIPNLLGLKFCKLSISCSPERPPKLMGQKHQPNYHQSQCKYSTQSVEKQRSTPKIAWQKNASQYAPLVGSGGKNTSTNSTPECLAQYGVRIRLSIIYKHTYTHSHKKVWFCCFTL